MTARRHASTPPEPAEFRLSTMRLQDGTWRARLQLDKHNTRAVNFDGATEAATRALAVSYAEQNLRPSVPDYTGDDFTIRVPAEGEAHLMRGN